MEVQAENPEGHENETEISLLTVGDLISQLQQYDPSMLARTVIRVFDEDEGQDVEDVYDLMYTEKMVDNDSESATFGQEFVATVTDLRTADDEDDFGGDGDGEDGDGENDD